MRRVGVIVALGALLSSRREAVRLPTVAVTAGAVTESAASDGTITSLTPHGHVLVNVCAALG